VWVRPVGKDDRDACARILYEAFKAIADRHNFPPVWASENTANCMSYLIGQPAIFGVVAELDGRIAGFNFLWKFNACEGWGRSASTLLSKAVDLDAS
jgi:hypothetical protein